MTRLLWLCTIALGIRMVYEMSFDFSFSGKRLRRYLYVVATGWWVALVLIAVWWFREF